MEKFSRLKISLTNDCNLSCSHCYLNQITKSYIDTNLLYKRIDEAKMLGFKIIDLTGGEPTLHPDFEKIVDYIGEKNFDIHLCTNGLLLTKSSILLLLKKYHIRCNISMDGISDSVMLNIRGINIRNKLEPTFKILKQNDIPFVLRFSINKRNIDDVQNILDYIDSIKPYGVLINITQLVGNAKENHLILDEKEIEAAKLLIEKYKNETSILIGECFTNPSKCDGGFPGLLSLSAEGKPAGCFMMSETYNQDANANMSLLSLWESVQLLKEKLRNFKLGEQCNKCRYKAVCESGCLVTANTMGCLKFN